MGELIAPPARIPSLEGRDPGQGYPLRASIALALPDELREVSGLTVGPDGRLVAVQDEDGALFFIDIEGVRAGGTPAAIERVPFGPGGDHEGVAWAGGAFFVLRSDGVLLELGRDGDGLTIAAETERRGPRPEEFEGLCVDPGAGRLLIAAKGRIEGKSGRGRERVVLGFDLASRKWLEEPVRVLDRRVISDEDGPAAHQLPHRTTRKGKRKIDFEMLISGLAVGQGDGELHLLSGPDRTLFVVDAAGRLLRATVLDEEVLPQPEGLTFLGDGTLVLSSEAAGGRAVLLVVD